MRWSVGVALLAAGAGCGSDHRPDASLEHDPRLGGCQTLFSYRCAGCHSGDKPDGDLSLEPTRAREQLVNVGTVSYCGADGIRLVPGDPDRSCLWQLVRDDVMPLEQQPLPAFQKELIYRWITDGALE